MSIFRVSFFSATHGHLELDLRVTHFIEVEPDPNSWLSSDDFYGFTEIEFEVDNVISFREGWGEYEFEEYKNLLRELGEEFQEDFSLEMLNEKEYNDILEMLLKAIKESQDEF